MAITVTPWNIGITLWMNDRKCWWIRDGKMCLSDMYPLATQLAYRCTHYQCGRETTFKELEERKIRT